MYRVLIRGTNLLCTTVEVSLLPWKTYMGEKCVNFIE